MVRGRLARPFSPQGVDLASASELPHHLYRRGARGEVGVCRVYLLTTYREEGLVGKLVCLYFLTTSIENSGSWGSWCLYFLTTYREEELVGKCVLYKTVR